tara:strand:+ start:821 stop:1000 length:180 start_codon:yes stop_codon:yes gene_type:complete
MLPASSALLLLLRRAAATTTQRLELAHKLGVALQEALLQALNLTQERELLESRQAPSHG